MMKTNNYDELLSEEINKVSKRYPEVSFAKLSRIAVHFIRWQTNFIKTLISNRINKYKESDISDSLAIAHRQYGLELMLDEINSEIKTCKFKPFDIVIYKPTGERGLVKSTNDIGAFVLFNIQSTAALCKYEDLELE